MKGDQIDFQEKAQQKAIMLQKNAYNKPDQQMKFFQEVQNQNQQFMDNCVKLNQIQSPKQSNKQITNLEHLQILTIKPQKKDNKEIFCNTPNLKENKAALVNNTIYNRNIKSNPFIKSRSSSLIKSRNNPNQPYQQIKINITYEKYIDELKFCKSNEFENTQKHKNQLISDIIKDEMQQLFNETAKFGQKFISNDNYGSNNNFQQTHNQEGQVRNTCSTNLVEQLQQTKRKYSETEKYKYKQQINKGNQMILKEENEKKLNQIINVSNSPTAQRAKYSSSSPNSIRIKQNNSFKYNKVIEYNSNNSNLLNSSSQKNIQNVSYTSKDSSKKLNNFSNISQNQNISNQSQVNSLSSSSSINKQTFYNLQNLNTADSECYSILDQQMTGEFRVSLKSKGSRAGSPGGCRIKVLPIKTNRGVLSEFQTVNSREGSPNSIRIKKYKYNENIDSNDTFQQNNKLI